MTKSKFIMTSAILAMSAVAANANAAAGAEISVLIFIKGSPENLKPSSQAATDSTLRYVILSDCADCKAGSNLVSAAMHQQMLLHLHRTCVCFL